MSLLSNISLIRSQEQAGHSIHAYEVDCVLSKCHMLSMTLKKSVSPDTLLSITAIQTMGFSVDVFALIFLLTDFRSEFSRPKFCRRVTLTG